MAIQTVGIKLKCFPNAIGYLYRKVYRLKEVDAR